MEELSGSIFQGVREDAIRPAPHIQREQGTAGLGKVQGIEQ